MRVQPLNDEVLVAEGPLVELGADDIAELKRLALGNERRRIRICAHPCTTDRLHEMLIVHTRGAYVRPHRHVGKSESVHVLEGEAEVVFFEDDGGVRHVVRLGPYESQRRFYYRLDAPLFHTLLIASDFFVMHEVTNGPFRREETIFAPWAPDDADVGACDEFRERLANQIGCALP